VSKFFKAISAVCFSAALFSINISVNAETSNKTFTDELLTYEIVNGGVNIIECEPGTAKLFINEEIDGYKIIGVGEGVFAECTNLTEVSLPDTITSMGDGAFTGCTALKKVNVPAGLTEIPAQTFALCNSLQEIEIPDTITTIGQYAFSYCDDLSWFEIPETVKTISAYAKSAIIEAENILKIPEKQINASELLFKR